MNMNFKSWLVGTTMLAITATGAFAEVVFNRGNSADPESLDPHKTSTVTEAHILRDLFLGLATECEIRVSRGPLELRPLPMARFIRLGSARERPGPMARLSPRKICLFVAARCRSGNCW